MILEEGELTGEPVMAGEAERLEVDLVGKDDIEIPGSQLSQGLLQFKRGGMRRNSLGLLLY